jgi:hypothetical protein
VSWFNEEKSEDNEEDEGAKFGAKDPDGSVEDDAGEGPLGVSRDDLAELASRPGPWRDLAAELVAIRQERVEKAEAALRSAEAEAAIEAGYVDFDDEGVRAGLREQVLKQRVSADARVAAYRRNQLAAQYGEVGLATFEKEQAGQAGDAWFYSGDPLLEHPAYIEHRREQVALKRQEEALRRMSGRTIVEDAADAEAELAAYAEEVLSRG